MGHKLKQHKTIESRTDFFYYVFRNILLVSLPLVIICGLILSHLSFHSSALPVDSINLSLPTSCSLSSMVNTPHNATIIGGTYMSNIGKTTITTLCNDGNGYAVYASGFSDGEVGNNALVSSVSYNHNIATGLSTSGNTSAWAMRLDSITNDGSLTPPTIESAYNGTYGLVPNLYTKVAGITSGTTDMVKGSSFTTTYAVYTAPTQHSGTYTGQVKYVLIHAEGDDSISNVRFMQDVANWKDELVEDIAVEAMDKRDFKKYYVTKLKDGNIWMTQNLDFNITTNATLDSETTDLNVIYDSSTGQYAEYNDGYDEANGVIYWEPASTATTINFEGTTVTGWQSSNTEPYSASKTDDTNTGHSSLGNYYNWTAAIASNDSSTLTGNTLNNISQNPQNSICPKGWRLPNISNEPATVVGSTNEFARLNYLYNNNSTSEVSKLIVDPLYFLMGGGIYNGLYSNDVYTNGGSYWSSTNNNTDTVYYSFFRIQYIDPSYTSGESTGRTIRCLARTED